MVTLKNRAKRHLLIEIYSSSILRKITIGSAIALQRCPRHPERFSAVASQQTSFNSLHERKAWQETERPHERKQHFGQKTCTTQLHRAHSLQWVGGYLTRMDNELCRHPYFAFDIVDSQPTKGHCVGGVRIPTGKNYTNPWTNRSVWVLLPLPFTFFICYGWGGARVSVLCVLIKRQSGLWSTSGCSAITT